MTDSVPTPTRRGLLYAILGGFIAATIPFYCAAVILIAIRPTPTQSVAPSFTPAALPTRQLPQPATETPPGPQLTATLTNTAFIPPTATITPTATETPIPTLSPPPTRTPTPIPTETPLPTSSSTEVPSETAAS
jgi:hypothetical protein